MNEQLEKNQAQVGERANRKETPDGGEPFRIGHCGVCEHPLRCEKSEHFDFCPVCYEWRFVITNH